jgi:biopolymer transport protein ExbD
MALQVRSDHAAMSDINVTPLVDVMLVLLVVFIVTAPLLTQAVPVHLPKTAATRPVTETHNVTLSINRQGELFLERQPMTPERLETELAVRRGKDSETNLLVQADGGVNFERVAQALASAQRAGITRLAVLTTPE